MKTRHRHTVLTIVVSFALVQPACAASLTLLPDWLNAPSIRALWLMPDGKTLTGVDGGEVFRWSPSAGRIVIGDLPQTFGPFAVQCNKISEDGNTIIGYYGEHQGNAFGGFVWTPTTGAVPILTSDDESTTRTVPLAVSADGSVVVGKAQQNPEFPWLQPVEVPFRWTPATGVRPLDFAGVASAVSADGTVIAGTRQLQKSVGEAVRWTDATGVEGLGFFPSDSPSSTAQAISRDGSVIVGISNTNQASGVGHIFRWTVDSGMQPISSVGDAQWPNDVSDDTNVIAGMMKIRRVDPNGFSSDYQPIVWTSERSLATFAELLQQLEIDYLAPTEDSNRFAQFYDLSADGRVILGDTITTTFPNNPYVPHITRERWLLDISTVPEPTSLPLLLLAIVGLLCMRRSKLARPRIGSMKSAALLYDEWRRFPQSRRGYIHRV